MSMKIFDKKQPFAQPILQSDPERVLVMQSEKPGRMVMLSPALRALRKGLPRAKITLMTSTESSEAAPLLPWIDDTIVDRDI